MPKLGRTILGLKALIRWAELRTGKILLVTAAFALLLRLLFAGTLEGRLYFDDAVEYHGVALSLLQGKGLVNDVEGLGVAATPPLYPFFLAACYFLFGESILTVRIVQALIGSLSCLLLYLVGREAFGKPAGLVAAWIGALYPFFVFLSGFLLTETLFIFLLLLLLLLLLKSAKQNGAGKAAAAGIVGGLAILLRPSLLFFPFLLGPLWILVGRPRWRASKAFGAFLIFALLTVAPWTVRNYLRLGAFVPVTTHGGWSLYEANSPRGTGGPAMEEVGWPKEVSGMSEVERDRFLTRQALLFIRQHPLNFLKLAFVKLARFWNVVPNFAEYRSPGYVLVSLVCFTPVLILGLWGIVITLKEKGGIVPSILALPILYYTLLHMVFIGSIRYRIPIDALLILFASHRVTSWLEAREVATNGGSSGHPEAARRPPQGFRKVSILIPVYNDARTIGQVLEMVHQVDIVSLEREVIVVDDGSTDGTPEILKSLDGLRPPPLVLSHDRNRGKGAAIRTALASATGDIVLIQDADLELDPSAYPMLLRPITLGEAAVVYGSRFKGSNPIRAFAFLGYLGNRLLSWATNLLYGSSLTDMETGYKVFVADLIKGLSLRADRFDFEPEVTAKLLKRGHHPYEVPVSYRSRGRSQGKKIKWRDGLAALWTLIRYRFME